MTRNRHRRSPATRLRMLSLLVAIACLPGCAALGPLGPDRPTVKVGLSEVDITPPIGIPMAGYRRYGNAIGVHDPLHARALAIEAADGTPVILMTVAVVGLRRNAIDIIRGGIEQATGVPAHNIMVSATHTHSGPELGRESLFLAGRNPDENYEKVLFQRCIDSGVEAWESRQPGRIGLGTVLVEGVAGNDRALTYGGLTSDPRCGVIKVEDARGRLIGVAFNFGMHPSTLDLHNLEFTEDYPHYAIEGIKERLDDPGLWVAFFQSAEGDSKVGYTAERSAIGADMPMRTYHYAEVKGRMFVEPVSRTIEQIETSANPVIAVANDTFEYPCRESYPQSLADAKADLADANARLAEVERRVKEIYTRDPNPSKKALEAQLPLPPYWRYIAEPERIDNVRLGQRIVDQAREDVFLGGLNVGMATWMESPDHTATRRMEQMAVRIGDAALISFWGEIFTDISARVKRQSPFKDTLVIGLANDYAGYLPPEKEFLEGHYAVLISRWSPLAGSRLVETSLDMLNRVAARGPAPKSEPRVVAGN